MTRNQIITFAIHCFPAAAAVAANIAVAVSAPPLAPAGGIASAFLIPIFEWLLLRGLRGRNLRAETRQIVVEAVRAGRLPMAVMAEWSITRRALDTWMAERRGPAIWWTHHG